MKIFALTFALLALALISLAAPAALAATADEVAGMLVGGALTTTITAESLAGDFATLVHFQRHDTSGMILFTDAAPAEGHVRNAMAHFDVKPEDRPPADKMPIFAIAFELSDEPGFTFDGLAAALERKLGSPNSSSNRTGAVFRTWTLKQPAGRTFTVARAQASDNGDPIIVVQLTQAR